MRTAQRQQVVAFKSFLRTLLHELCHHLDYEHLALDDSFHTEGFYQRESSLFHQIVQSNGSLARKKPEKGKLQGPNSRLDLSARLWKAGQAQGIPEAEQVKIKRTSSKWQTGIR